MDGAVMYLNSQEAHPMGAREGRQGVFPPQQSALGL